MLDDPVSFHDVAEVLPADDGDGVVLQRVPEAVRETLSDRGRIQARFDFGVEVRFVPGDSPVELTLSAPEGPVDVVPFWGPFQAPHPVRVGPEPTAVPLAVPEAVADLAPDVAAGLDFSPRVCRVTLPRAPVRYHGVEGAVRPPRTDELPDRRLLAYGTSITEGNAASAAHLTYVAQAARRLGADPLNLGFGGSAYCEPAVADHVAGRDDWDAAVLSVSVNMVANFPAETFRERARYLVEEVAAAHPDKPVVAVTVFPYHWDLRETPDGADPTPFRRALRDVVAEIDRENVALVEGSDLLADPGGLSADLIHPGDAGMAEIGAGLAERLRPLL